MRMLLVMFLLTGCASWNKPNSTLAELNRDDTHCQVKASEYPARLFYRAVYAGCMENRGWSQ